MAYKALYRSYRPKNFDEMVGQKHIVQTIKNSISENKIAHAYLFSGPRGTGKTSMAKLLAKALNCQAADYKKIPCNECENCRQINLNSHPDVIEIDAASNNGVDEVRELIDKVKYAPILGKYKVYIIDEIHMMSTGAFNALLKTLEEPPSHVVFILATTDVHKVLPTIISRCQRFDFGRVSASEIKRKIHEVLLSEKIMFEEDVLDMIADLAEGGMRDALSILDQTMAYAGKSITVQHIRDIYGIATTYEMIEFLNKCNHNDVISVLNDINEFENKGLDFVRLTTSLIDVLKETIIYKNTNEESLLRVLNANKANLLAKDLSVKQLFANIDIFIEAQMNYRRINSPKDFFQLAALKICQANQERIPAVIKAKEEVNQEPKLEVKAQDKSDILVKEKQKEVKMESEVQTIIPSEAKSVGSMEKVAFGRDDIFNIYAKATKLDKSIVNEKWALIKKYLNIPAFSKAANMIVDGQPIAVCKNAMVIIYDLESQADAINLYHNQLAIRALLKEIYGREYYFYGVSNDNYKLYKLDYMNIGGAEGIKQFEITEPKPIQREISSTPIKEEEKEKDDDLEHYQNIFGQAFEIKD